MAAARPRLFSRKKKLVNPVTCLCTNPDERQFPAVLSVDALQGEFELPTAGDVEWLLFSYT